MNAAGGSGRHGAQPLGFALLVPAGILFTAGLLVPWLRTFAHSVARIDVFGVLHLVGVHAYQRIPGSYWSSFGQALLVDIMPLAGCLLSAPVVAYVLRRVTVTARLAGRWIAAAAVALFAPVVVTIGYLTTLFGGTIDPGMLGQPAARLEVLDIVLTAAAAVGPALGAGLTVFLAAGSGTDRRRFAVLWAGLAAGAVALCWQSYTVSSIVLSYRVPQPPLGFRYAVSGTSAAAAGWVLLTAVGVCGLFVGLLVIKYQPRLVLLARRPGPLPVRPDVRDSMHVLAGGALCVLALMAGLVLPTPWLLAVIGRRTAPPAAAVASVLAHTLGTPLATAVGGVIVGYLGGLAVSAFRPLGRYSRWLLLPFAPGLFLTAGTLGALSDSRTWSGDPAVAAGCGIPALFLFSMIIDGHRSDWLRYRAAGDRRAFLRCLVRPAAPLALLLGTVGVVLSVAGLYAAGGFPADTGPELLATMTSRYPPGPAAMLLAAPFAPVALVILVALQRRYLDRLVLRWPRRTPVPSEILVDGEEAQD